MGYLQSARQRLTSAARTVGKHAVTAGKVALTAAAVAGAAYNAYQTQGAVQARRDMPHSSISHAHHDVLREYRERMERESPGWRNRV